MQFHSFIAIALFATLIGGRSIDNIARPDSPLLTARGYNEKGLHVKVKSGRTPKQDQNPQSNYFRTLISRVLPYKPEGYHIVDIPKEAVARQKEEEYVARVVENHKDQKTNPSDWFKNAYAKQKEDKKAPEYPGS